MFRPQGVELTGVAAGRVDDIPFNYLLWHLNQGAFTGLLELRAVDGPVLSIALKRGGIRFIRSAEVDEERLGWLLVNHAGLPAAALARGLERAGREGSRLGDALIALGLVESEMVERGLKLQVMQRALRVFCRGGLTFRLTPTLSLPEESGYLLTNIHSLILSGVKAGLSQSTVAAMYNALLGYRLSLRDGFDGRAGRYRFSREDWLMSTWLYQPADFSGLCDRLAGSGEDPRRFYVLLAVLHSTGELLLEPLGSRAGPAGSELPVMESDRRTGPDRPPEQRQPSGPPRRDGRREAVRSEPLPSLPTILTDGDRPVLPSIDDGLLDTEQVQFKRAVIELFGRIDQTDHFEALLIRQAASRFEVDAALHRQLERYNPDRVIGTALAGLASPLAYLCNRLRESHRCLTEPGLRRAYMQEYLDPLVRGIPRLARRRREADDCFRQAEALVAAGRFAEAGDACGRAVELMPQRNEWYPVLAWCHFMADFPNGKREALRRGLEWITRAVKRNPTFAEAYFVAGRMYEHAGDRDKAIHFYGRAIGYSADIPKYKAALARAQQKNQSGGRPR